MKKDLPPNPNIAFDTRLHISPFELFRALTEEKTLVLVDIRPDPKRMTFRGAVASSKSLDLPKDVDWVVFDDDGDLARDHALELQSKGHPRCRALYGGLLVYELAIDPAVIWTDTFLRKLSS